MWAKKAKETFTQEEFFIFEDRAATKEYGDGLTRDEAERDAYFETKGILK